MSAAVTVQDFPEIRWRGHWIWVPEEPIVPSGMLGGRADPHAKEAHGLFRKRITLAQTPARAPARITADSRYALYVNGVEVGRGPVRSQPRRLHYDLYDLAPYLAAGENVLAVYVKYYGTPKSFWMPAAPNLTLGRTGILVLEADLGAAGWVVSDPSWKAHKAEGWSEEWRGGPGGAMSIIEGGVPVEVFDARLLAANWQAASFDDSAWGAAQVVPAVHIGGFARTQPPTDPYGPLLPRPIGALGGEIMRPVRVRVEPLAGVVDSAIGSPVKRVEASLKLEPRAAAAAEQPARGSSGGVGERGGGDRGAAAGARRGAGGQRAGGAGHGAHYGGGGAVCGRGAGGHGAGFFVCRGADHGAGAGAGGAARGHPVYGTRGRRPL